MRRVSEIVQLMPCSILAGCLSSTRLANPFLARPLARAEAVDSEYRSILSDIGVHVDDTSQPHVSRHAEVEWPIVGTAATGVGIGLLNCVSALAMSPNSLVTSFPRALVRSVADALREAAPPIEGSASA